MLIQWSYTAVPGWKNLRFKLHEDKFVSCPRVFYIQTRIQVKRAAVSVVKSQTIVSPPPTTSSHGSMLRFSRMQMGDVFPPARPDSALGSRPGLARCLDRFGSWWGGTAASLWNSPLEVWAPHPLWEAVVNDPPSSFQSFASEFSFFCSLPTEKEQKKEKYTLEFRPILKMWLRFEPPTACIGWWKRLQQHGGVHKPLSALGRGQ